MHHSESHPSSEPKAIAVFIAEKLRLTAWCLSRFIGCASTRMTVLGVTHSFEGIVEHSAITKAEVVLLDPNICTPFFNLQQVIVALRHRSAARVVVMAETYLSSSEQVHLITLGVQGILDKSADETMLVRAIRKVHEGQLWINRQLIGQTLHQLVRFDQKTSSLGSLDASHQKIKKSRFTPREQEVIRLMTRRADLKQLAIATELGMSEHTLRNHLTAIYKKLGVRGRLALHAYATKNEAFY